MNDTMRSDMQGNIRNVTLRRGVPRPLSSLAARWSTVLAVALLAGCATTGATLRSGVGDAFPEHPPYYAGTPLPAVGADSTPIGHLPVAYQRGATQPASFDPRGRGETPVGRLLADMTGFLDSLGTAAGVTVRLAGTGGAAPAGLASAVAPDVQFGCLTESNVPGNDCAERGDSALGRSGQRMRLAVGRPSPEWTGAMRDVARAGGVGRVLVLTLEVGEYLPRQVGLRGSKEVELGTGYVVRLPWLTSLETPVSVLQLTGALVDTSGRAVRIGAEGILAVRTRLAVSAVGGQELVRDADVEEARTLRRDDLAQRPLAWQVALRHLVSSLTGRDVVAGQSLPMRSSSSPSRRSSSP